MFACWFAVALPMLLAADAGGGAAAATGTADSPPLLAPVGPPRRTVEQTDKVDLKESKDGTGDLVYEATGFTARIAPDGSVRFTDKRASGSALPWLPMSAQMGVPSLQSSLKMLLKGKAPPPRSPTEIDQGLAPPETKQLIPEVSRYRPDPREGCRACPSFNEVAVPFQGASRFDLTDELTRFSGKDPNRQQKAMFLASTRERRIEMAVKTHAANIRTARAELPARLQAISCDDRLSYKERRAILVALAREMDATTTEGSAAAKTINDYVTRFDSGDVACAR